MVKVPKSFKTFITENKVKTAIERVARELLGSDIHTSTEIDEKMHTHAREIAHKFVDTPTGPWVIQAFKAGTKKFVRAIPPKEANKTDQVLYFFPKQDN